MSFFGHLAVTAQPLVTGSARWVIERLSAELQDEGSDHHLRLTCLAPVPGQSKVIYKFSGALAAGWRTSWHDVIAEECKRRGARWTPQNVVAYNASFAGKLELLPAFDGLPFNFKNYLTLDRRTNVSTSTPENPGIRSMFIQAEPPTAIGTGRVDGDVVRLDTVQNRELFLPGMPIVGGTLAAGTVIVEQLTTIGTTSAIGKGGTYRVSKPATTNTPANGTVTFTASLPLDPGTGIVGNGTPVRARDVSQTPPGTPEIRIDVRDMDGNAVPQELVPGDKIKVILSTKNIKVGTKFRLYAANLGNNKFTSVFRFAGAAAARAAGLIAFDTRTAVGNYNGFIGQFDADSLPGFEIPLEVKEVPTIEGKRQVDFILFIDRENGWDAAYQEDTGGAVEAQTLITRGVETKFLVFPEKTGTQWRVQLKTRLQNGYARTAFELSSPGGSSDATVDLTWSGQLPTEFNLKGEIYFGIIQQYEASTLFDGTNYYENPEFEALLVDDIPDNPNGLRITSRPGWKGKCQIELPAVSAANNPAWNFSLRLASPGADLHGVTIDEDGEKINGRVLIADAVSVWPPPALPPEFPLRTGVNLSGGEFGSRRPGTYGPDYGYPSDPGFVSTPKHRELDYWLKNKKAGIVRLPVFWERIQRAEFGPLYPDEPFTAWRDNSVTPPVDLAIDMHRVDEMVDYVTVQHDGILVLDVHNYARFFGQLISLSSERASPLAFYDLWERLGNRYKGNPRVWFGIMNEPHGYRATDWFKYAQGVTNAIRARTGATNKILVPGTAYTGAWSWFSSGNADAMEAFVDPFNNFAFELHQYLDGDSSGTKGYCDLNAHRRLVDVTEWARGRGAKLYLGEFMGGDPTIAGQEQCGVEVPAMCQYMADNRDVWIAWTAWGGGRRWKFDYIFRLDPVGQEYFTDIVESECTKMIAPFLEPVAAPSA